MGGLALGAVAHSEVEGPDGSALVLSGMTFVGSHGSESDFVLEAKRARVMREGDLVHLEQGVHAKISGEREGGLEMTCDSAEYHIDSNDFVAIGNVRGRTGDGRRFQTSKLHYDHSRGLATTEVPVLIIDESGTYRGGGFRYHVRDGRFALVGGATLVQQQ
jgi:LPS export ABC transporter protein LptC